MKHVLFVCEHGAAKSVVAAAHFNRLAAERGLALRAISRGTDPDATNHPVAVTGLAAERLEPTAPQPKALLPGDVAAAARVIAFGELPLAGDASATIEVWTVPPVSEGYEAARAAIVERLEALVAELDCHA